MADLNMGNTLPKAKRSVKEKFYPLWVKKLQDGRVRGLRELAEGVGQQNHIGRLTVRQGALGKGQGDPEEVFLVVVRAGAESPYQDLFVSRQHQL
jgi:hypothetical protein